jgi:hypothetical protein
MAAVSTMVFITHCLKKSRLELSGWLAVCFLLFASVQVRADVPAAEVTQLRLERVADALQVSATLRLDLSGTVEDALQRGVPVFFVADADVFQERWYWADKKVLSAQRHFRLVYQPLTRRWRLAVAPNLIVSSGTGLALTQVFESLPEAIAAIGRISGWQIGSMAELSELARHRIEFKFRLDVSQLPRPLQIGVLGQSDWILQTMSSQRFVPDSLK